MTLARSRGQIRNFRAEMAWEKPRGRIVGPYSQRYARALNPAMLPLQVTSGQLVYVKKAFFEYKGPAATLQIGVGWKAPTSAILNFNSGQNLIRAGDGGYGFSTLIGVPSSSVFAPVPVTFSVPIYLLAPVIGTNIRVSGATFSMSGGSKSHAWIWIYDVNTMGGSNKVSPDAGFLVIDDDADVIQLKSPTSAQAVQGLEVEYTL